MSDIPSDQLTEIVQFRKATIDDAAGIASVIHAIPEISVGAKQSLATTVDVVKSNLAIGLSTNASCVYLAETEPDIVGYIACHWTPFLFLSGGEGYVTELFVVPKFARRGIGSELLRLIEHEARSRGCSRLSLLNGRDRASYEQGFYSKRGWTERKDMRNFVLPMNDIPPRSRQ